jgi:UDP-N-acetyl-2-amino-2-deoxyglucuronate dehydrogenase
MANNYGVGIIGAGWVAGEYVKAFRDHPQTNLVGVYNRTPGKASALLETHGVEAQEYGSVDDLFDDERVQIVVSCTPPDVRPEHVTRAAESGRHVVIEKPVALNREGVEQIRKAVSQAGVKTVTSFVLRWNPQLETIKQLVDDGIVGDLIYAEGDYWHPIKLEYPCYDWIVGKEIGGSSFVASGVHAVDAVRWLGGQEIVEVTGFSAGPKKNLDYTYEPVTVASVKFANGAIGKLSSVLDGETPYIFNTRLFGTEGTIQNNRVYSSKHYPGSLNYWEFPTVEPDSGDVTHHPFVPEIAHFIECIDNDVESHASIHDSYKSMAVCFAIDESAAQGGEPVKVALD